jgi:hypothetical protein
MEELEKELEKKSGRINLFAYFFFVLIFCVLFFTFFY